MADEKDRFGETMRLVERTREDIYFGARPRVACQASREVGKG